MPDSQVTDNEPKTFTQERLDEIISERLREQKAKSDAEKEEIIRAGREEISRVTGKPVETTDFLAKEVAATTATNTRLEQLETMFFGPSAAAGRRANDLANRDIAQYRALRDEFETLKSPGLRRQREEAAKITHRRLFQG